jgi:hypothetical protein
MLTVESVKFRMMLAGMPEALIPEDETIAMQIQSCNKFELLDWIKRCVELELDNHSNDFLDVIRERGKRL